MKILAHGGRWCNAARSISKKLGLYLDTYIIGERGSNADLIDVNNLWSSTYGVESTGAVLVRPDGFVAWRANTDNVNLTCFKDTTEYALRQVLAQIQIQIQETTPLA